jgi:hypothetical protein
MSRIRVTIDRLALRGFSAAERTALVDGLKRELSRSLADPAAREGFNSRRTPVLKLGAMPMTPGPSGGRSFGVGLARAITRKAKI